jgi:hypothetical protein
MSQSLARPEDILVAYDTGVVSLNDLALPLEVTGGNSPGAFPEITGGSDSNYDDFTSSLREFVEARRVIGSGEDGGPTMVGGWFGGTGADPSAVVLGIDWLSEKSGGQSLEDPGGSESVNLLDMVVVKSDTTDSDEPEIGSGTGSDVGGLLSYVVDTTHGEPPTVDKGRSEPPYQGPEFRPETIHITKSLKSVEGGGHIHKHKHRPNNVGTLLSPGESFPPDDFPPFGSDRALDIKQLIVEKSD